MYVAQSSSPLLYTMSPHQYPGRHVMANAPLEPVLSAVDQGYLSVWIARGSAWTHELEIAYRIINVIPNILTKYQPGL